MKRLKVLISLALVFAALLSYGTYSLITGEGIAKNIITMGTINFEIKELGKGGKPFPTEGVYVLPGSTVDKVVSIKNTGLQKIYFRIKLLKSVENSDLPAEEQLKLDINTTEWTYKDGYYYHNEAIGIGKETTPLFTKVYVDGASVDNKYLGKTFLLKVRGEYVQSKNNGNSPFEAVGWSADSGE